MAESIVARLGGHNPDVLNSIANLSNDEVFTPPHLARQMIDGLEKAWAESNNGASIWEDPNVTFLDPFTKSGVFLREIVSKLNAGLADQFPDLQERVDHILTKQVFGIAVTQLTSLLARRSVYCSKKANGKLSITDKFDNAAGNIWFEPRQHEWVGGEKSVETADKDGTPILVLDGGRCKFCNAPQNALDRAEELETHAYEFIHVSDIRSRIREIFGDDMQFDVIIGNPPYQLGSDGGTRDVPIYHKFVDQAKLLEPRFLCMVIPSRWMATGLGLTEFRNSMLQDRRVRDLVDFPAIKDAFPNVEVKGGVCYFLWQVDYTGDCQVTTIRDNEKIGPVARRLDEFDVFVRDHRALAILKKILLEGEDSITSILSVDKEFGWTSNFDGFHTKEQEGDVPLHYIRSGTRGVGFIARKEVTKSSHLIDTWKVLIPAAGSDGGQKIPDSVLGKPKIVSSPSVCTQSFLFFGVDSYSEAESLESYLRTRLFRFLVSLRKITQHATRSTYTWVPIQNWDQIWTDEILFEKYGITPDEVAYIESMIRPMEVENGRP